MARALDLARLGQGATGDNPSVGCVLVDRFGRVVGEGVTATGGRPHAEEIALDQADGRASGGTAYVTLEPCGTRSTGTDACSTRLIDAGIARVVCAVLDPHPLGSGGLVALQAAGVAVRSGVKSREANRLYAAFFRRVREARQAAR